MTTTTQDQRTGKSVRERLLAAADELFYSQGVASTGVDAVIERAGVATGSLYKNFAGKDGLVVAYLHARDARWRSLWEDCIGEHTDPVDRVLAIFTAMERWSVDPLASRGCAHLAVIVQLPHGHPGIQAAADHKDHLRARLTELCTATSATDPADLTDDLLLIYEGTQNTLALSLDPDSIGRGRRLAQRRLRPSV
ncbi:MAG: TetR/AcrR family transcriptional regulator [Ornithinimicrobium sp.]